MKSIFGFRFGDGPRKEGSAAEPEAAAPVRSLISVRFIRDGRAFTYYNDRDRFWSMAARTTKKVTL